VFLSRQSGRPSLDFVLLESALRTELPGWEFASSCYRDTGDLMTRIGGTLRHLRLVASSRLCVVDGYSPAVSIPHLNPSTVVVQLWHALGTFKRFGWQAIDTAGGRTKTQARHLRMHRNYSMIIAGGEGARVAYAQAFDCPEDRIVPLGMPRMDYLLDDEPSSERAQLTAAIIEQYPQLANGRVNVLFAPTFRKGVAAADATQHLEELASHLPAETFNLIVAFHPLSTSRVAEKPAQRAGSDEPAPLIHISRIPGIDLLPFADYVITDYSAIAFEAALLRRKVVFYVPDIAVYRNSPGLNIDPEEQFSAISFRDVASLASFIRRDMREDGYTRSGFWSYCDAYLAHPAQGATARLARHLSEAVGSETAASPAAVSKTASLKVVL
jgi:CDP-ribitol ribitolphosphotransferase